MMASRSWWVRRERVATEEDMLSPKQLFQVSVGAAPGWKQAKARCGVHWFPSTLTAGFALIRVCLRWRQREVESALKDSNDQALFLRESVGLFFSKKRHGLSDSQLYFWASGFQPAFGIFGLYFTPHFNFLCQPPFPGLLCPSAIPELSSFHTEAPFSGLPPGQNPQTRPFLHVLVCLPLPKGFAH